MDNLCVIPRIWFHEWFSFAWEKLTFRFRQHREGAIWLAYERLACLFLACDRFLGFCSVGRSHLGCTWIAGNKYMTTLRGPPSCCPRESSLPDSPALLIPTCFSTRAHTSTFARVRSSLFHRYTPSPILNFDEQCFCCAASWTGDWMFALLHCCHSYTTASIILLIITVITVISTRVTRAHYCLWEREVRCIQLVSVSFFLSQTPMSPMTLLFSSFADISQQRYMSTRH